MSGSSRESHCQRRRIDNIDEGIVGYQICNGAASRNGGGGIRDISVEGLADEGEEMENRGELGLEPEINPQADYIIPNNEENPFPSPTSSQSPQHSPQSVVDSVSSSSMPVEINRASDLLMAVSLAAEPNKIKISELANSAMEELVRKAFGGDLLWQRQVDSDIERLNEAEYIREFRAFDASLEEIMRMIEVGDPQCFATLDGNYDFTCAFQQKPTLPREIEPGALQTEASREVGFVKMNATSIVEWLMDLNQWSLAFSKIVSRATILGVLSTGMSGSYDETLQVMRAEFQVPTPLVPIRECQFARYCKQVGSSTWGVVDVSLEDLFPYPILKFRRRPSGCLIEEMSDGNSKVTWVEHVEVDNTLVHRIFQPLVLSGIAFSARRWVATLIQHCEWVATVMCRNVPLPNGGLKSQTGKERLLRLTERMMRSFCVDISASTSNFWMPLPISRAEDFRVMTKTITPSPASPTTSIAFASSLWLPAPPRSIFNFLRRSDSRNKWDLLSRELVIRELTYIIKGDNPENRISILQANSDPNRIEILYLQESYSDPTGFYIVYAPMDVISMATLVDGGNPDYVNILPSGFVIHPSHKPITSNYNGHGHQVDGSVLTLFFHILDGCSTEDSIYIPRESLDTVHRILTETSVLIKDAVVSGDNP
ncbi:homeobox-leucine zipper protein PROTODERMAL FACTOR 2 isoform X2 [Jatropha curcas]|uniref:homeobox-leucine zipper protein PROTODERMAL FACTOR 2 isoform X2 n=1 Tax=Jatropha curcas TaxID=180498 RepID=UPI001893329A|nr:homeobox-leucine zipper protein PROTODERMAL FACTOR 2 isoform X2 [Jatropha curcas]